MRQHIKIELSDRIESILYQLINKSRIEKGVELRLNIVLMRYKGYSYQTIKERLHCVDSTISNWTQRWSNNYEKLKTFISGINGKGVSRNEIKKEILIIMGDAPRSGKPVIFTDEIQKKIMAVACETPEKYDLPFSHWTHDELAKQVIKMGIVDNISGRHLGRLLKKTN